MGGAPSQNGWPLVLNHGHMEAVTGSLYKEKGHPGSMLIGERVRHTVLLWSVVRNAGI